MQSLADLEKKVRVALDAAGYDVKDGKPDLFGIDECDRLVPAFHTCFGNNPAAPYIVPAVPHGEKEVYDYGKSMRSGTNNDGEPLYWTHRLEEHEAILMFGNLPSEAAFIGYETFLFTRYFDGQGLPSPDMDWLSDTIGVQHHLSHSPDNLLYDNAPIRNGSDYDDNPNRVVLFANGPTINRRDLEKQISHDFWEQQAIFSTSADASFKDTLNAQLGTTLADIHLHSPLGSDLKMGLTDRDDDFWTLMRYAVPKDQDSANEWRQNLTKNLVVLRVSKRKQTSSVNRHPIYSFEEKKANTDERYLAADLQTVADAVSRQLSFGKKSSQEVCVPLSGTLHAPVTIPRAMSAVGATHDADYRISAARPFESEEVFAVVGVNHVRTHNSSYVSLGIYDASIWKGIRGISQGPDEYERGVLADSVQRFFDLFEGPPAELTDIDHSKFYIHVLARPDADLEPRLLRSDFCTVIGEGTDGGSAKGSGGEDPIVLDPKNPIRISERAYLNPHPSAGCGPDFTKLLSMILLVKGTGKSGDGDKPRRGRSTR